jgi:hypothetical protein
MRLHAFVLALVLPGCLGSDDDSARETLTQSEDALGTTMLQGPYAIDYHALHPSVPTYQKPSTCLLVRCTLCDAPRDVVQVTATGALQEVSPITPAVRAVAKYTTIAAANGGAVPALQIDTADRIYVDWEKVGGVKQLVEPGAQLFMDPGTGGPWVLVTKI